MTVTIRMTQPARVIDTLYRRSLTFSRDGKLYIFRIDKEAVETTMLFNDFTDKPLKEKRMTTQVDDCCLHCGTVITDPDFGVVLCQEEYEDIDIGPFCEQCMARIKICSGCQHPFKYTDVKHVGNGDHYCESCLGSLKLCQDCGKKEIEGHFIDVGGKLICKKCFEKNYFLCNSCGEYHSKAVGVEKSSLEGLRKRGIFRKYGPMVCIECYEKRSPFFKTYDIEVCNHCGNLFCVVDPEQREFCPGCWGRFGSCTKCGYRGPHVELYTHEGKQGYFCMRCVDEMRTCDCCGELYSHSPHIIHKKFRVCNSCKDATPCRNCGVLHTDSSGYCYHCRNTYIDNKCSRCGRICDFNGSCRICDDTKIYSYSTKPKVFFNYDKEPFEGIFFGFENEVSFGDDRRGMNNTLENIYKVFDPSMLLCKSDSTIAGKGFEIVTQPMDLTFFKNTDWSPLFDRTQKSSSCGLHVHVDRRAFLSDIHLYKVCNILYRNPTFREYIAGRSTNHYCENVRGKVSTTVLNSKKYSAERYQAVNLKNKNTVEFRMFAGCTTETELRQKIEILIALITYQKNTPIRESNIVKNFIKWVCDHKKQYPNGLDFLLEKYRV